MRKGSYSEDLVKIVVPKTAQLSAMAPSTETYSSVKVVNTAERAFALDTCIICLLLSKEGENSSECRKVQYRHCFNEVDVGCVSAAPTVMNTLLVKLRGHGVAPDAHVIADGQTAETCGQEANILKQKVLKFSEPVSGAVPPEAWRLSMPNIRSARPETGSLARTWAYAVPSV